MEIDPLIRAFAHGTTDLFRIKIVMQSERFVVFVTPGHSDWSGVGMRSYYASHTVLLRKGEWYIGADAIEWYGRISKKTLKAALDKAEKSNKIEPASFGDIYTGASK